jgi:hypothetical protein
VTTPLEALQETLAAEHAAVYVYGVLGGRLSTSAFPTEWSRISAGYDAHRSRRDLVRALVADRGADPAPAAAAYAVQLRDGSADNLLRAAREIEEGCAEVYSQLVAATSGAVRRAGIDALTDAGLRLLELGGEPTPYPGAPDLG